VAGKEESFEECGSWKSDEDAIERNWRCWILSWAVTLEISARRRRNEPMKNL
jgi:hypothetical protein